jgi:glycerol uptake facilitator-like aquaporin
VNFVERLGAETLGTAFLLAAVVGSGIMGERLAGDNVALALLANSVATGAVLAALILAFFSVSGAHFNPIVSLAAAAQGKLPWREVPAYITCQCLGAVVGVVAANVMFDLSPVALSGQIRTGPALWLSEFIASLGLIMVIGGAVRHGAGAVAAAVGCYITAAYWFTASTSFANPAVTLARVFTDSFAGIRPADMPAFIGMQLAACAVFILVGRFRTRPERKPAAPVTES